MTLVGLLAVISEIAGAVEDSGHCVSPRERLVAGLLRPAPRYGSMRRLDLWETHVAAVTDTGEVWPCTPCEEALERLYELARLNLYGRYSPAGTAEELRRLEPSMAALGLSLDTSRDVSQW